MVWWFRILWSSQLRMVRFAVDKGNFTRKVKPLHFFIYNWDWDLRFKIVYCYTSVSRHIHTKHIVTSWKLFRSCNHSKKKHIMTSWHRNQCCKTHWANNTGQDRGQLIEFGHCPGQHCRPIRKTLILNTRNVSLDNLILSAFLKERDNMASFSNSDSCAPRLISLKTDCGILWVQGLVEAIESPWFLWRMFKKSNFALVAPDESRILMNYNFSLKEQTSVISLYYIQHPEGSATSKLINPWVTLMGKLMSSASVQADWAVNQSCAVVHCALSDE